eukprot:221006-Hanusia_phi.AAC.2
MEACLQQQHVPTQSSVSSLAPQPHRHLPRVPLLLPHHLAHPPPAHLHPPRPPRLHRHLHQLADLLQPCLDRLHSAQSQLVHPKLLHRPEQHLRPFQRLPPDVLPVASQHIDHIILPVLPVPPPSSLRTALPAQPRQHALLVHPPGDVEEEVAQRGRFQPPRRADEQRRRDDLREPELSVHLVQAVPAAQLRDAAVKRQVRGAAGEDGGDVAGDLQDLLLRNHHVLHVVQPELSRAPAEVLQVPEAQSVMVAP